MRLLSFSERRRWCRPSSAATGLYAWKLDDRDVEDAIKLSHLNPQTQEFTIDDRRRDNDR